MIVTYASKRIGYTEKLILENSEISLNLLVKPDTDIEGQFLAFCVDTGYIIRVRGWLFE